MKTLSEAKKEVRKILNDYKEKKEKEGKTGWIEASAPLRDSLNGLNSKHTFPINDHDELRKAIDKLVNVIANFHYPYGQSSSSLRKQLLEILPGIPTNQEYADYIQENKVKHTISTLENENKQLKSQVDNLKSQLEQLEEAKKESDELLTQAINEKVNLVYKVEDLNRQIESLKLDNKQLNRQHLPASHEDHQPTGEQPFISALAAGSHKYGIFNGFNLAFGGLDITAPQSGTASTSNFRKYKPED